MFFQILQIQPDTLLEKSSIMFNNNIDSKMQTFLFNKNIDSKMQTFDNLASFIFNNENDMSRHW